MNSATVPVWPWIAVPILFFLAGMFLAVWSIDPENTVQGPIGFNPTPITGDPVDEARLHKNVLLAAIVTLITGTTLWATGLPTEKLAAAYLSWVVDLDTFVLDLLGGVAP